MRALPCRCFARAAAAHWRSRDCCACARGVAGTASSGGCAVTTVGLGVLGILAAVVRDLRDDEELASAGGVAAAVAVGAAVVAGAAAVGGAVTAPGAPASAVHPAIPPHASSAPPAAIKTPRQLDGISRCSCRLRRP